MDVVDLDIQAVNLAFDLWEVPEYLRKDYMLRLVHTFRKRLAEKRDYHNSQTEEVKNAEKAAEILING